METLIESIAGQSSARSAPRRPQDRSRIDDRTPLRLNAVESGGAANPAVNADDITAALIPTQAPTQAHSH
jgi:hypothetical protein